MRNWVVVWSRASFRHSYIWFAFTATWNLDWNKNHELTSCKLKVNYVLRAVRKVTNHSIYFYWVLGLLRGKELTLCCHFVVQLVIMDAGILCSFMSHTWNNCGMESFLFLWWEIKIATFLKLNVHSKTYLFPVYVFHGRVFCEYCFKSFIIL